MCTSTSLSLKKRILITNIKIIDYINANIDTIEKDMNKRNSSSKNRKKSQAKTRKKRKELSVSATKSIKKEKVEIVVKFD